MSDALLSTIGARFATRARRPMASEMRFGVPGSHMEPGLSLTTDLDVTVVFNDYEGVQIRLDPDEAEDLAQTLIQLAHAKRMERKSLN